MPNSTSIPKESSAISRAEIFEEVSGEVAEQLPTLDRGKQLISELEDGVVGMAAALQEKIRYCGVVRSEARRLSVTGQNNAMHAQQTAGPDKSGEDK